MVQIEGADELKFALIDSIYLRKYSISLFLIAETIFIFIFQNIQQLIFEEVFDRCIFLIDICRSIVRVGDLKRIPI